jgi:hypothetical protein
MARDEQSRADGTPMARLAIIFGAGASYDFLPDYPAGAPNDPLRAKRIPLANDLFDNRPEFAAIAKDHRRLLPLLPELRNRGGSSVEELLEDLRSLDRANRYWPIRQSELMAVRFYLQSAVWSAQEIMLQKSNGISNYAGLIRNIEEFRSSDDPVILITFNYDTLIEQALSVVFSQLNFSSIQDYIRRPEYKLFKLHGSLNWGNPVLDDARLAVTGTETQVKESIIELAPQYDYEIEDFQVFDRPQVVHRGHAMLPAISIPVRTKSHFSCPPEWLPLLYQRLEGVRNILVIGWSAGEDHFLVRSVPIFNKNPDLKVTIVSASEGAARQTEARLTAAGLAPERFRRIGGGFTSFMNEQVKVFLRREDGIA